MEPHIQLENRHTGETLRLRRIRDRGQIVLEMEGALPPRGDGPPLHIHVTQREEGAVLSGVLSAHVGGRTVTFSAGEQPVFPAGVPHRWWNGGDEPLRFHGRAVPAADLDRFLQAVFAIANAGTAGRPSVFHMVHLLHRHRHTQRLAGVPVWLQRIVLPAVVLVGRVLRRYPPGGWPGAPGSCLGAPEADVERT
ncbi:MAG TPA: cupin domain-containing protein [Vicinamibacterales bacterium]|jgi:mannose-6-phosphate isomerase-like protein (cupin superfamily)|nr:cupin domain-containing protein [Vicinamibacterales bacterium]